MSKPTFERLVCEYIRAWEAEQVADAERRAATEARHAAERAVDKRAEELGLSDACYIPPSMPGYVVPFGFSGVPAPKRIIPHDVEATEAAE